MVNKCKHLVVLYTVCTYHVTLYNTGVLDSEYNNELAFPSGEFI